MQASSSSFCSPSAMMTKSGTEGPSVALDNNNNSSSDAGRENECTLNSSIDSESECTFNSNINSESECTFNSNIDSENETTFNSNIDSENECTLNSNIDSENENTLNSNKRSYSDTDAQGTYKDLKKAKVASEGTPKGKKRDRSSGSEEDNHPSSSGDRSRDRKRPKPELPLWFKGRTPTRTTTQPEINEILNKEVRYFVEYISPTAEEHQMRKWVATRIQQAADTLKLGTKVATIKCYGSFSTKLYLPTSGIDATVVLYETKGQAGPTLRRISHRVQRKFWGVHGTREFLVLLAHALRATGFCASSEVIAHTRVPVILARESVTGLRVSIAFNASRELSRAAMQEIFASRVYPKTLRALILVVKQVLVQHALNDAATGGLNSYALSLLAISFLQTNPRCIGPSNAAGDLYENVGILLLEFFEFYGKRFDYRNHGIGIKRDRMRFLTHASALTDHYDWSLALVLEDPCDSANSVARRAYRMADVKKVFSDAHDLLINAMYAHYQAMHAEPSAPAGPVSFLSAVLDLDPAAVSARAELVRMFYNGAMQEAIGVAHRPALAELMPSGIDLDSDEYNSDSGAGGRQFMEALKLSVETGEEIADEPSPVRVDEEGAEWEVEEIVDHISTRHSTMFLVHWMGFGEADRTWEPEANLLNAPVLLEEYRMANGLV